MCNDKIPQGTYSFFEGFLLFFIKFNIIKNNFYIISSAVENTIYRNIIVLNFVEYEIISTDDKAVICIKRNLCR